MSPVVLLSLVYFLELAMFVFAFLIIRLRSPSTRVMIVVVVLAAVAQIAGFVLLIVAAARGWLS